jgi:glycosyltransferase involved in cell wall biosynthesis
MRVLYSHNLMAASPNGITSYIRNFLKYSSSKNLEYWSPFGNDGEAKLGDKTIALKRIHLSGSDMIPTRIKIMMAISKIKPELIQTDTPLITNINDHAALFSRRRVGAPVIFISHGSNHPSIKSSIGVRNYLWIRFFDLLAVINVDKVIVVSHQAREVFCSRYPQYANKIFYFPTFLDDQSFKNIDKAVSKRNVLKEFGFHEDTFLITYAGRLSKEKQVDLALKSFAKFHKNTPDSLFLIMGSGPEELKVRKIAEDEHILSSTIFLGDCEHNRTLQYLFAADLSMLLSTFEGTSLFLLESLASGTPVIALDVADHHDILENNDCGSVLPTATSPEDVAVEIFKYYRSRGQKIHNALMTSKNYMASIIVPKMEELINH